MAYFTNHSVPKIWQLHLFLALWLLLVYCPFFLAFPAVRIYTHTYLFSKYFNTRPINKYQPDAILIDVNNSDLLSITSVILILWVYFKKALRFYWCHVYPSVVRISDVLVDYSHNIWVYLGIKNRKVWETISVLVQCFSKKVYVTNK